MASVIRTLLARSLDYAGMFPPCSLDLASALRNQAKYVRAQDAWMLSTFVLPIDKFAPAASLFAEFNREHPLRISALGPKTKDANDFRSELKTAMETVRFFSGQHVDLAVIDQLEMPLPANIDLPLLSEARSAIGDLPLRVFWETPADDAERTIALLAQAQVKAFGYKLRTGGVTADVFPSSQKIARALVASAKHQVPIKFTAGLHHPVRQFRDEVNTKMHGFLNVLGAGVLAAEHNCDEKQTAAMLDDEDATAFSFDENRFAWREWGIDKQQIFERRKLVTSFGSCSFDEPREDLRALDLL